MDEAQGILLSSLVSSGVSLPTGVSLTRDLTPDTLISICAQSIRLIDDSSSSFPTSLPVSMAERFKICADIASAVKSLGYKGDLSFHQFLYPSDEDSYKLVRFLVERLSESSESKKIADKTATRAEFDGSEATIYSYIGTSKQWTERVDKVGDVQSYQTVPSGIGSLGRLKTELSEPFDTAAEGVHSHRLLDTHTVPGHTSDSADAELLQSESLESRENETLSSKEAVKGVSEDSGNSEKVFGCVTQIDSNYVAELEQKLAFLHEQSSKLRYEVENLQIQEQLLVEATHAKALEAQNIEREHEILKAAVEMAFDDQHSVGYHIEELNQRIEAERHNILELELQWNVFERTLEEKKMSLEESVHAQKPEVQEKLIQLKEIEQEAEATISASLKREVELSELRQELERQPKIPPRKSYIQRITEITKNSWKQDADIDRIIQETRELQIESNSIEERLHRTYAVADETVFRDAKKDPVRRQAYRLLTSIHDSFEQISDKILATDRARREAAELEAKLTAIASRSFDVNNLQADIDSIRKENEFLEQQLHHN